MNNNRGAATRAAILQSAINLFIQKGYNAVTMHDICIATGLSRGGLYRHFASTKEIMSAIIDEEQSYADEQAKLAIKSGHDAVKLLDSFLESQYNYFKSTISKMQAADNQYSTADSESIISSRQRMLRAIKRVSDIVERGQNEGYFIEGDATEFAWHIMIYILGLRNQNAVFDFDDAFLRDQFVFIKKLIMKRT